LSRIDIAAASFAITEVQVKYEKYDWFVPTSFRPRGHCEPKLAAADRRFIRILGCCGRRPVLGANEFRRFAGAIGVRVRHARQLDRRKDGATP
jgi:hypothetical protein